MVSKASFMVCVSGLDLDLRRCTGLSWIASRLRDVDVWMYDAISVWPNRFLEACRAKYGVVHLETRSKSKIRGSTVWARGCTLSAAATAVLHYAFTGGSKKVLREFVRIRYDGIIEPGVGLRPGFFRFYEIGSFKAWIPPGSAITSNVRRGAMELSELGLGPEEFIRLYHALLRFEGRSKVASVKLDSSGDEHMLKYLSVCPLTISSALKVAFYVGVCRNEGVREICDAIKETGLI